MIIFRIIFTIILLPLLLLAYALKLLFSLVLLIGGNIIMIIGTGIFLFGVFFIVVESEYTYGGNIAGGIGIIIGGVITFFSPYIAFAIIAGLSAVIEFIQGYIFG